MDEKQVSVLCTVYNHEKYLRKCLDGFVMQQGVTFEVIIHDDASTDNSTDIIREYENNYPNLFKPIYQTENQSSKGVGIYSDFLLPNSTGKYTALCEGDDYWTDPYKLKKQYDALEANPQCFFCTHAVQVIAESGEKTGRTIPETDVPAGFISKDDFFSKIWNCSRVQFQTSGYFVRASVLKELCTAPPKFSLAADVADTPSMMYFIFRGGVYFVGEEMSCYREGAAGSWSQRMKNAPMEKRIAHYKAMQRMFSLFSDYTQNTVDVSRVVNMYSLYISLTEKNYSAARHFVQKDKSLCSRKERFAIFANVYFPRIFTMCRKIKNVF